MQVLLDTQAVLTAYFGNLPRKVMTLLEDPETEKLISSVSIMEVALKHSIGKLKMEEEQMQEAIHDLLLTVIPFEQRHAYRLFHLPLHHRDPFDRMIIATGLVEGLPVVGADRQFRRYKGLKVIW